jgi:hypothetical protein
LKKKRKKGKTMGKVSQKRKEKRKALWIPIVIHNALCVGNSDSPTPFK